MRDLFVKILGYTLNHSNDFNLTTELKNVKDSKKVEATVISSGHDPLVFNVKAIIELKGTNTSDLSKVKIKLLFL